MAVTAQVPVNAVVHVARALCETRTEMLNYPQSAFKSMLNQPRTIEHAIVDTAHQTTRTLTQAPPAQGHRQFQIRHKGRCTQHKEAAATTDSFSLATSAGAISTATKLQHTIAPAL